MSFCEICNLICRRFVQTAQFACIVLLILSADQAKSCAGMLVQAAHENLLQSTAIDGSACSDGGDTGGVQACSGENGRAVGKATFLNTSSSSGRPGVPSAAETPAESVSDVSVAAARIPDWNGVWRDTGLLFGSQVVAGGIIYLMPESFSGWSSEQKKNGFKKFAENVFNPVIDEDSLYINYALHPYWGATYYIRARERGLDKVQSFIYSSFISAMYEFGVECFFERPSIQDLVVTPVAGSLLGAFVFEPWRESIKRKQDLSWYDHAALVITDPVGVLSLGFEKMFGIKSTITVDYSVPQLQKRSPGSVVASKGSRIGIVMQFPFD